MTMRRIAGLAGLVLAGFAPAGCATATIEDAVPAGALTRSVAEMDPASSEAAQPGEHAEITKMTEDMRQTPPAAADSDARVTSAPAGVYPNLNVAPAAAAPQISAQKKAADRAELRAHQKRIAGEGRQPGLSQDAEKLRARARGVAPDGRAVSDDGDALRRLADTHGEDALKQIEGR